MIFAETNFLSGALLPYIVRIIDVTWLLSKLNDKKAVL